MAITWKTLGQTVMTGSVATIYSGPDAVTRTSVSAAQLWNPTGAPVTCNVYLVPSGGSATDATQVDRVIVPAASARTVFGLINQKVNPGASIRASGNGVTITVSGSESV